MTAALPLSLEFPFAAPPQPGSVVPVAPGVRWLRMPLPFALDHINLWLLEDGDGFTLVDCGIGSDATRAVWETLLRDALAERALVRIIVTHCHPDHVGNAEWLSGRFGCPVVMTHGEYLSAHAIASEYAGYGTAHTIALFLRHGLGADDASALERRGNQYRRLVPSLPENFTRLIDDDHVPVGDAEWRVIEGHGHSPEHASLWNAAARVLISGDMLLPRISTNVSVWAIEPDGDPLRRFLDSLARFEALPPDTLVLPSHGMPFRGIPLRVAELRGHHAARLAEVEAATIERGAATAAELLPVLFRRELDLHQRFFAMGEAIAHLNHLWHSGRLRRVETTGEPWRFAAP
jgi:glyoxylase-like metal-dependent hydrolase (beta-lactamase superfamily II)